MMAVNSTQIDGYVGNTAPADREVADAPTAASNHVCEGTSEVVRKASPRPPESVRGGRPGQHLGKTYMTAVQDRVVVNVAALAEVKHPLPISPCREWFALFILCRVGCTEEAEWGRRV